MKKTVTILLLALSLIGSAACATPDEAPADKVEEADAPIDGKLDGSNVVDQGPLQWTAGRNNYSATASTTLGTNARAVAWTFTLSGDATVSLNTQRAMRNDADVDTVMYLYEQSASGTWGRYIERNDDTSSRNFWSTIRGMELGEGKFRVVIKGYSSSDTGRIGLQAQCSGAGCMPSAPTSFEAGFNAVKDSANFASESDYNPVLLAGTRVGSGRITLAAFKSEFAPVFAQWFTRENETNVTTAQLAYDEWTSRVTNEFLAGLHNGDSEDEASEAAWATIHGLINGLTDVRAIEVGVKDEDGSFDPDNPGLAALCFFGRDASGKIVGFYVGAVWT